MVMPYGPYNGRGGDRPCGQGRALLILWLELELTNINIAWRCQKDMYYKATPKKIEVVKILLKVVRQITFLSF